MKNLLELYQKAINEIDDYFEYRYLSASKDDIKKYIDNVLDKLTTDIKK